jgi:hypothetical protein
LFTSSSFWLTYVALVVCSLLPDLTFKRFLLLVTFSSCVACVIVCAGVRVRS